MVLIIDVGFDDILLLIFLRLNFKLYYYPHDFFNYLLTYLIATANTCHLYLIDYERYECNKKLQRGRRGGGGGGRSGSSGGLFGAKRTPAPPARKRAPPPAPAAAARPPAPMQSQAPAPSGGGMLSGIGSTIAQGMAFGTGSAIAHRAVGAVAGSMSGDGGSDEPQQQQQYEAAPAQQMDQQQQNNGACAYDKEMFFDCLKQNKGDQESCSFLYQQLQSCQQNETTFG